MFNQVDKLNQLYHSAKKKIPHIDENGIEIKPKDNCGYKLELFIHDFLVFMGKDFAVFQVPRDEEFAPVYPNITKKG